MRTHPCPPYKGREKRTHPDPHRTPSGSPYKGGEKRTHPDPPYKGREMKITVV